MDSQQELFSALLVQLKKELKNIIVENLTELELKRIKKNYEQIRII